MTEQPDQSAPAWAQPDEAAGQPAAAPHGRRRTRAVALVGAGVVAGGVLAGTLSATASTSTPKPTAPASTGTPSAAPGAPGGWAGHHPGGRRHLPGTTGTVTAVGATSVTIRTGTATTTCQVTSASHVFANGKTTLSAVKVGDTVRFSTVTTNGTATIEVLLDGQPPAFGHRGRGFGRALTTGTVTAVGASSVTIRTGTATTTYQVTASSRIVHNGTAGLSAVKVGDTVHFASTTTGGTAVIEVLLDGPLPTGGPGGGGPGWGPRA